MREFPVVRLLLVSVVSCSCFEYTIRVGTVKFSVLTESFFLFLDFLDLSHNSPVLASGGTFTPVYVRVFHFQKLDFELPT